MKPKSKMGRPLKGKEKRSIHLMVKITPGEARALKATAKREGISVGELVMKPWRKGD
jgi:hypothetical protein